MRAEIVSQEHSSATHGAWPLPTDDEVSAYRDLFRAELDKRMDTSHPSSSPSTEAHAIALRKFVEARNAASSPSATRKVFEAPISHEQEPHCCGCWIVWATDTELYAKCNECGERRDLLAFLSSPSATVTSEVREALITAKAMMIALAAGKPTRNLDEVVLWIDRLATSDGITKGA